MSRKDQLVEYIHKYADWAADKLDKVPAAQDFLRMHALAKPDKLVIAASEFLSGLKGIDAKADPKAFVDKAFDLACGLLTLAAPVILIDNEEVIRAVRTELTSEANVKGTQERISWLLKILTAP